MRRRRRSRPTARLRRRSRSRARLRHPQWSFDGTYLSIEIMGEAGVETAVLLTK